VPTVSIRALSLLLREVPSQSNNNVVLSPVERVSQLSAADKDNLLCELFESGHLSRSQALSLIKKQKNTEDSDFQYWLSATMLEPYTSRAAQQLEQERLIAEQQGIEQACIAKEKRLKKVYSERDAIWRRAEKEALRACASAYDNVSAWLHELSEAYSFKSEQSAFSTRYQRLVKRHQKRKALLRRLEAITREHTK
jgi:DNA polymerase III psi subunit